MKFRIINLTDGAIADTFEAVDKAAARAYAAEKVVTLGNAEYALDTQIGDAFRVETKPRVEGLAAPRTRAPKSNGKPVKAPRKAIARGLPKDQPA